MPDHSLNDKGGNFKRVDSSFRDSISRAPNAKFPPEKGRYALYVNVGCPWAHRTIITRSLKSLDSIIQIIRTDAELTKDGWLFTGLNDYSDPVDPLYGFKSLSQLYRKADPEYSGRFTVPVLWDKKTETVVNNESSEIIRMLYSEFDDLLPTELREENRPGGGYYPPHLRSEIDAMNEWVYNTVNNGVYKCGFAGSQEAYDSSVYLLFQSLDRLEAHLGEPGHSPYLFGASITEADIRLYTTMIRFDVAYYPIFHCNLKMIRHDYPRLSRWLRNIYWDEGERTSGGAFHNTTYFHVYKYGYLRAKRRHGNGGIDEDHAVIIPAGPLPDIQPLTAEERAAIDFEIASLEVVNDDETPETQTQENIGAEKNWPASDALEALPPKKQVRARMTHGDENAAWEKQIKKASKGMPPDVHLALA